MKKLMTIIAVIALAAVLGTLLIACSTPSDPESAEEKMKKAGYVVETEEVTEEIAEEMKLDGAKKILYARKDADENDYLYAIFFESSSKAKAYYKEHKDEAQYKDLTIGQSGKWVYAGSEAAVKAFK